MDKYLLSEQIGTNNILSKIPKTGISINIKQKNTSTLAM